VQQLLLQKNTQKTETMKLNEIKESFEKGLIDKHEFISKMYEIHIILNDYVHFLPKSGIEKIEINSEGIVFVSRNTEYHSGGIRFFSKIDDKRVTPLEAFNFGRYEDEDSEMIYKLIKPNYTVFDIGANIGWYTNHIAKNLEIGNIHAFEPIPDTFESLVKNVKLNNFPNIKLNNIALSDSIGELNFYYSSKMTGASSSKNITKNEDAILVNCKTNTIDEYAKEFNVQSIDFIKCDVEGAELFAFRGGVESIKKFKPIVFTEMLRKWASTFGYHPNDIIELFKNMDYSCYINSNGKLLKIERIDDATIDTNFFFMHLSNHSQQIADLT
jgi:FkbM family methyltransferase